MLLVSIFYFILALIGLGFLIFIHELGHYVMARRTGMRVESFGIGFGKPIYSFMRKGVKWNICWLPFGGYVKIAGMEKEGNVEPQDVPDGFFGKSPLARMQVAIMGPLANLALALLLFAILWAMGGQHKSFSDTTNIVGWVDPKSELYRYGVRPGDSIISYDGREVHGSKDHFQAAMMAKGSVRVVGSHFDPETHSFTPFSYLIKPYSHPLAIEKDILTTGVLSPASYLIYGGIPSIPKGSPLYNSGLKPGDRIVWVDGDMVYSLQELTDILNDERSLLTVKRGNRTLLRRVPRILIEQLKLDSALRDELQDWQWEADLRGQKLTKLYFIPYNMNAEGVIEAPLGFLDAKDDNRFMLDAALTQKEEPLQPHDQIIAVDGVPVRSAHAILTRLQKKLVHVIVERQQAAEKQLAPLSWKDADKTFQEGISYKDIQALEKNIGADKGLFQSSGNLIMLAPVTPCRRVDFALQETDEHEYLQVKLEEKKQIQAIEDPKKREQAMKLLESRDKQLLLGLPGVQDMTVHYNPDPLSMFIEIVKEVGTTLSALVGGYLHPKWLSGPIGIVQVIQANWMLGIQSALFWVATISMNLGLLNLLPLPVLDGGYIFLSVFEMITGKRLSSKTIEKIVIPFAVALIGFFIFLTYNDIVRLLGHFFK